MDTERYVLIDLEGLKMAAARQPNIDLRGDLAEVEVKVDADPFSGTLKQAVMKSDLIKFRDQLRDAAGPGRVSFVGGRGLHLVLDFEIQEGGRAGSFAMEVTAGPSEDDPWPVLRYLVFDVEPTFLRDAATTVDVFLRARP